MPLSAATQETAPLSRSEQKKQQILSAAIELFCGQGFPSTSMDEVAKLAGVSKQTVYSHYGSKDELYVAAIESRCVIHNLTEAIFTDPTSPEIVLSKFSEYLSEMIVSPEALTVFCACVAQSDSHPEMSKLFYDAGPEHLLGLLSNYLASVNQQGKYHFDIPRHCAVRLCLMLFGEMRMRLELGLDIEHLFADREAYVQGCITMFLKAYLK